MKDFATIGESGLRTVREVVALAQEMGFTPAQVALAWLRHRSVPVIPIIGARKLTQLEDNRDGAPRREETLSEIVRTSVFLAIDLIFVLSG